MGPDRYARIAARVGAAALAAAAAAELRGAGPAVDFARDIQPILRAHCLECHGPKRQSAGLRLDDRRHAEAGGVSGLPVLGGTLQSNELWRRVSAEDPDYRMPRFGEPLEAGELERIRLWVEQGSPWPAEEQDLPLEAEPSVWSKVYRQGIEPTLPWLLAILVAALAVERLRARPLARAPRLAAALRPVRPSHALLVGACLVAVNQFISTGRLQARYDHATEPPESVFGDPPVPRRPDHARRLSGTYYRGNCERDDRLYNGGNYRTCSFHVALVDAGGRVLGYGDPVPAGALFVRFEIERARKTTEQLFQPAIMEHIFLTEDVLPAGTSPLPERFVEIEVLEPSWRWQARYPIWEPEGPDGTLSGLIYVYRGGASRGEDRPSHSLAHYALRYDVRLREGRVAPESELWMGALYTNPRIASPPEPDRVPFDSWFSDRPLPEIDGASSDDPALLGLEEHLGPQRGR